MKNKLLVLCLSFCALSVYFPFNVAAQTNETKPKETKSTIVISSGKEGGAYAKYASKLSILLNPLYKIIVNNSSGGYENLNRVANNEATLGFAQADTIGYFFSENSQNINRIQMVKPLNKECVFLVTTKDGKVQSDSDLQKSGIKVGIGDINSGSYYTYHTMIKMEPGFGKSNKIVVSGLQALSLLSTNNLDAMIFVTNPDLLFETELYKNVQKLKLVFRPITDWDLNDNLPNNDKPIYTFESVKVYDSYFNSTVSTICLNSYLVSIPNIEDTLLSRLFLFETN